MFCNMREFDPVGVKSTQQVLDQGSSSTHWNCHDSTKQGGSGCEPAHKGLYHHPYAAGPASVPASHRPVQRSIWGLSGRSQQLHRSIGYKTTGRDCRASILTYCQLIPLLLPSPSHMQTLDFAQGMQEQKCLFLIWDIIIVTSFKCFRLQWGACKVRGCDVLEKSLHWLKSIP